MQFVVITGLSGAGKATVGRIFEDLGSTVVDNLPPGLLPELVQTSLEKAVPGQEARLAVILDCRAGTFVPELNEALDAISAVGVRPIVLFLDSSDAVLVQRFKETRRRHPLYRENQGILGSLAAERALLENARERADKIIDTSDLSVQGLRELISEDFALEKEKNQGLEMTVTSFGFKYGIPLDADLVLDVRFLKNPHYDNSLRALDGRDSRVQAFIAEDSSLTPYLDKIFDLIAFSIPRYMSEGKAYLNIAFGCTGGRHRSVMISEKLAEFLRGKGYHIYIQHRDVLK